MKMTIGRPLATLKNLTLTYPHKTIFSDVTFTLHEGDRIGVLGLNGHGKSSLFKILAQTIVPDVTVPPFIYDQSRGFSLFAVPQELPIGSSHQSVHDFLYLFYPHFVTMHQRLQVIATQLEQGRGSSSAQDALLAEQSALYEQLQEAGEAQVVTQYESYLRFFGLGDDTQRPVRDLSGGEQRKLALSLGLSAPHAVVLWDEPTNHLDLQTLDYFEDELLNSKKTFMMISHDRSLLARVVDRILHIQNGKLSSFQGSYEQYLIYLQEQEHAREMTIDRLENRHRQEKEWISRGARARRTKSKKRIEDYATLVESISDLRAKAHQKVSLNLLTSGRKTKLLLQAQDLGLELGGTSLFRGLNFKVQSGDKIALLGRNGVGKSSLLRLMTNQLAPTTGQLQRAESLEIGFFSQKREALDPEMTPWQLIGEGIDFIISNSGEKRHVTGYLKNFLFQSEELKRPIKTFSGGEQNRLQLAQFMKHSRDLWIFDEPTNDLDLETIAILERELIDYKGALIVVCHDRTFIENVTNQCWLLDEEKLEIFGGGLEQAEAHLEMRQLEQQLARIAPPTATPSSASSNPGKMTYKEKQRYQLIQAEVEAQEVRVDELKQQLATFDYGTLDRLKKEQLAKLQTDLREAETKMEALFEEWQLLEEKASL